MTTPPTFTVLLDLLVVDGDEPQFAGSWPAHVALDDRGRLSMPSLYGAMHGRPDGMSNERTYAVTARLGVCDIARLDGDGFWRVYAEAFQPPALIAARKTPWPLPRTLSAEA